MVTQSIIRHLLCDDKSLRDYLHGRDISFDDVERRLMLLERLENRHIPDHFYRMNQKRSFKDISTIGDILTKGLSSFADEYLEMRGNRIYVKQAMQNQWQGMLPYISPLILQSAFLAKNKPLVFDDDQDLLEYYTKYILPNFRYTALPYPYIPQLEHYISDKNGLHDLHMHLNGSTEIDIVWQAMLFNPQSIHAHNTKIREQLDQEDFDEYDIPIVQRLSLAKGLRAKIFKKIYLNPDTKCSEDDNISIYHPMINIFDNHEDQPERWMPLEGLMGAV